jgi:hypothetical protein
MVWYGMVFSTWVLGMERGGKRGGSGGYKYKGYILHY